MNTHQGTMANAPRLMSSSGTGMLAIASRRLTFGAVLVGAVVLVNEANLRVNDIESFEFDWQNALRLGICLVCGLYGLCHLRYAKPYLRSLPGVMTLLLVGWIALTAPLAVQPVYALGAAVALGCITLFAPAVLATVGTRRLILSALIATLIYLVGTIIFNHFHPNLYLGDREWFDDSEMGRLGGFNHPNGVGRQIALAIGLMLTAGQLRLIRWRLLFAPLALAAWALHATDSRTAMIAAACVVAMWSWRRLHGVKRTLAALSVVLLAVLAGLCVDTSNLGQYTRSGSDEEVYTLTGRTDLWRFCWERIQESPVCGYGFGCGRFVITEGHDFQTHHAHNLMINVALGTGLVGAGILLLLLLRLAVQMLRHPSMFPDTITILVIVGGLADSVMLNPMPDSHTLLFLLALYWRVAEQGEATRPKAVGKLAGT